MLISKHQHQKKMEIKKHRKCNNIRCLNCKSKISTNAKNDFKSKERCVSCFKIRFKNPYEYANRTDIWKQNEDGKWIKNKKKKDNWWYVIQK
jgi:hypothetical protein